MRSFILASIVALAFAATPAFEHNFESKNEYVYKFDGLVLSGLPTSQQTDMSQSRISARARLQSIDDRHIHLQLVDIQMAASNVPEIDEQYPELRSLEQRDISKEYKTLLELPVRAQIKNGLVSNIQFDAKDAEWSKNVKRSVLNMISFVQQQPTEEVESRMERDEELQSFFTNEKTIEGDCQVAYTINRENKKTIVTKTVNFNKCESRPQAVYGNQFSEELSQQEQEKLESFKPQTVYTYTLENELLKEVEVRSIYSHNLNGQEVMKTETRSKLTLEDTLKINKEIKKVNGKPEEIIYSTEWERSVEDFFKNGDSAEKSPFEEIPTGTKMTWIKSILENIQEDERNGQETVHQLARLVRLLRTTTSDELEKIHKEYYNKKEEKIQRIIDQALAIAGTKNTIEHYLNHLEYSKQSFLKNPNQVALLLKSIQETPYPSEKIADLVIKFSKKVDDLERQSAILAYGTIVRGILSQKVNQNNHLIREDTRDLKEKYLNNFMDMFRSAERHTYKKILALKGLGNAGIDISVNEINSIINDRRQPLVVRREAIDCLRLLDNIMPLKLQRVLLPIYKNRQNAPELRMAALWRLIQTRPQQSVLVQIVSQMEKESNQQVQHFTYQLLKQFSQSTNPQYRQLASDCVAVLSFTRVQSQLESSVSSTYAQLPMFARDFLSGAQFDFSTIFSKNSLLPSELQASLESVFGGNWNKHLIQFGFTQQNVEGAILKTIRKMRQQKEREMTRGDRSSEEKITLLQKLAKQLKLKVRQQDSDNQEAFGSIYLRYKNIDQVIVPFTERQIEKVVESFVSYKRFKIADDISKISGRLTHSAFFYETIRQVPTTLGLPLTLSGKIPTVATFEGELSLDSEALTITVRPSIAATHIFEMKLMTPLFEQGVKSMQSIKSYTPLKLQWSGQGKRGNVEIETKINVPEQEEFTVQLSSRPAVYLRYPGFSKTQYVGTEEKTLVIPQLNKKTQDMEKTFNVFGLEITTRGNVLRQWTLENVLFADQDYELVIKNNNGKSAVFSSKVEINTDLDRSPDYNLKKVFEKEFEVEGNSNEARRQALHKLVEDLKSTEVITKNIIVTLRAPEKYLLKLETDIAVDEMLRAFKTEFNVLFTAEQDWTLNHVFVAVAPEMIETLEQLRKQPHRQIMMSMITKWGLSKQNKKNQIELKAQLGQSKEQRKYQRYLERQSEVPEYDLIVKSARLNQLDVVAQYKLNEKNQQQLESIVARLNWYFNQHWAVSTQQQDNEENRMHLRLTVDPITREYVNMTVQTPEQQLQLRSVQVPRIPLPSVASWKLTLNKNNGQVCTVSPKRVQTFDDMIYSAPLTTCWSVIAKDCSEQPEFVVLAKKESKNSKNLIVKYVTEEKTLVLSKIDNKFVVERNGEKVFGKAYGITYNKEYLLLDVLEHVTIQYDGQNVHTKLNHFNKQASRATLCGLCGNNDNEMDNELRTAEDEETEDIEKFHRSFLLNDDECKIEEDIVSDKKNYRKMEKRVRSSYELENEDDEEYETEDKKIDENNLTKKTEVKEFAHRICFSLEGVPACRRNYDEKETVEQKIKFTCLQRHDAEARRLLKKTRQQDVLQLKSYPVSFVQPIVVPTQCEYAY